MPSIKVGDYLFTRLKQLGVQTVFGVPGDYELALLDLIGDSGIQFAGNPNELIAAYAADGYGRVNGVGAWVDTYGPGELSSYCGHAGAYAEFVPTCHIVGYPGRQAMQNHAIMHHTLGTGEFLMYHEMAKHISVDTTILTDSETAPHEIDRCMTTMLQQSRPVYIGVPVDMSHAMCDDSGLKIPLDAELPPNDAGLEAQIVTELRDWLEHKKSPIIIIDGNATRHNVVTESQKLSRVTGLPTFATAMGKGSVDETAPNFGGVYLGGGSHEAVREVVEGSDAIFWIGNFPSDFNTGEFTVNVPPDAIADFQRFFVKIGTKKYDAKMKSVLRALLQSIEQAPLARKNIQPVSWDPYPLRNMPKPHGLTQDYLWQAMGKWFRSGDYTIAETGTSAFGIADSKLPAGAVVYNQTVFGSIGYATGAAVGAFKAVRERGNFTRCILITGEGSLHLTVQAFADMLKLDLQPIVFVLNNSGYTVERLIHGKEAPYNKVPDYDYSLLAKAFGPKHPSKYYGPIDTTDELERVLADEEFNEGKLFRFVELKLGYLDAPACVKRVGAAIEAFNEKRGPNRGSMGG